MERPTFEELSNKLKNVFLRGGIDPDPAEVRRMILEGELYPSGRRRSSHYGYGPECHAEVCLFAGLPEPERPLRR